jgi:hypothetical protein
VASEIQIINRALSKLGTNRCTSRTDVSNKGAREADACFDIVRDAELRRRLWRFALARAPLSALSSVPDFGYAYEYQLPSDCLRVVMVGESWAPSLTDYRSSDESLFSIEGRKLLTDLPAPLSIRYVKRITDAGLFDACFVESLAARLAYEMADAITGSTSKKESMFSDYRLTLDEALSANAVEMPPEPILDDTWVMGRR